MIKEESDRLSVLRRVLHDRLGAERYELWLGPQTQLELGPDELRVVCGSTTVAQWLRRNLHATLNQCAIEVLGRALTIVFAAIAPPAATGGSARRAPRTASTSAERQLCFAEVENLPLQHDSEAGESAAISAAVPAPAAPQPAPPTAGQLPRWSFSDFVVGDCNRLAVQAALQIAQQPGRFSPLLAYGPPGCGKTHLLHAIAHGARAGQNRPRVMALTAEQFTSQFLEALSQRTLPSFRQKIRGLDVLAIDDVQFLGGKRATLDELLYTIDALHARGAQIALASDRPAAELQSLSGELTSRISAGLAVALDPPDYPTRRGIVWGAARRMHIDLGDGVAELVAQQVVGSGRLLSGALNRLVAASMAAGMPITVELAEPALSDFCRQHAPQVRLSDIQRAVCEVFGVESATLKSPRKSRAVAEPRMLAMWLARRYTRAALSEIGDFFGRRSHSTVVSAQRKFDQLISRRGEIVVGNQACRVEEALRRIEAKLRTA
ncbi:MAG: chromosomal replication initiator protein DnaA [Pirellulales bacterium]|nr:chromosomal replication initiator protein DnaA [Pirellulales bacterium]